LEQVQESEGFDIHKLGEARVKIELPEAKEKDFDTTEHAITEYFDEGGKNHEEFVKLKKFYEAAQAELGDLLPKAMFVEGEPSDPTQEGRSFYVVQRFDNQDFNKKAKALEELNSQEFSVEFLNQLLAIQERLVAFIETHQSEMPQGWVDSDLFDPKKFKEDILHSADTKQTQIVDMFRLSPELAKEVMGNEGKFEPSKDRLKALKMIGLAGLIEKIEWAFERSGAKEWVAGRNVHWKLNSEKMKKLEKEGKKVMALTFDDGPNEETEKLLDILKEQNAKATFFLVGSLIPGREDTVKRIVAEGHDIGVHEWSQEGAKPSAGLKEYSKRFVGPREDLGDVKKTTELIEQVSGVKPTIGRIAGVHGTTDSLREFQAMNLEVVHANPYDVVAIPPSTGLKAENLLKKALSSNGHGRIRLFHIGTMTDKGKALQRSEINFDKGEVYPPEETLKMINEFIERSRSQGYDFVKVQENI
jgi:peptidoglycan/xylan/chitin deacetylase (PgdA/CDA1 family)